MHELLELAKNSEIPEVLEAVAAAISYHASTGPMDEKFDWYRIVHELRELADCAREYEQHFAGRRG
jgi:hypothetical protein